MKKLITFISLCLAMVMVLPLMSCTGGKSAKSDGKEAKVDDVSSHGPVCSADEALKWAKGAGALVYENGEYTGAEAWNDFHTSVLREEPASLLLATYMTSNDAEADHTPQLTFYYIVYNGEYFVVSERGSDEKTVRASEKYMHLLRLDDDYMSESVLNAIYMLVDNPTITWKQIMEGMLSSASPDMVKHFWIYSEKKQ